MNRNRLSQGQLEDLMREIVLTALNTPKEKQDSFVRFTWPENNQPGWKRTQDLCFVQVVPQQSDVERQRNAAWDGAAVNRWSMRVIGVSFLFYGPHAWDNAVELRYRLFDDAAQGLLRQNRMALVTDIGAPVRAPELFNAQWWDRADLFAQFNETITETSPFTPMDSAQIEIVPNE